MAKKKYKVVVTRGNLYDKKVVSEDVHEDMDVIQVNHRGDLLIGKGKPTYGSCDCDVTYRSGAWITAKRWEME
jgi:hypothetical protein